MSSIFRSIVFLCVLCILSGSAFAIDREAFAFERYDLKLQIDPELRLLNAGGSITLRNLSDVPQHVLSLQISSQLNWADVEVKNAAGKWQPVQYVGQEYITDIDHTGSVTEAVVSLPFEVAPKQNVELKIGYAGEIDQNSTRLDRIGTDPSVARRVDWDRIDKNFSALRGMGFVVWYPVASDSVSLSDGNAVQEALARWRERETGAVFHMELCFPTATEYPNIITSGRTIGSSSLDAMVVDSRCGEFEFDLGHDTPVLAIGAFRTLEWTTRIAYLPSHEAEARAFYNSLASAQQSVSPWFGGRTIKAELVDLPFPALPFETGNMRLMNLAGQDPKMRELELAHLFTHALLPSERRWIFEGAANFMQAVVKEGQEGRPSALELLARQNALLQEIEKQNALHPEQTAARSLINSTDQLLYGDKSAWVFWMLRDMTGDTALKSAFAQYDAAADKRADTFQKLLEASSKKDLEWFFDDWVYRDRGLPDFQVESASVREVLPVDPPAGATAGEVGKNYLVTVTVQNHGGAGAEVPVQVSKGNEVQSARVIVKAHDKSVVRLNVSFRPEEVRVNDGSVPEAKSDNNIYKLPEGSGAK